LLGETSIATYIEKSKLTGQGRNGFAFAHPVYDYMAAHQDDSVFWTFVDKDTYYDKSKLADTIKPLMLIGNVYYFFIRKNCLPQCLYQLRDTIKVGHKVGTFTDAERRKTIELLLIGYMIGVVLMPGAHRQF
jgi:hypothetical protein